MTDVLGYDPTSGAPISVPQEAAAQHYKAGKIAFKPTDQIPVVLNGVPGTLPASDVGGALESGDAELNFDPHSAAKASAAAAVRGGSAGLSDMLAIEGQKLLGDPDGAEKTRQSLAALREEHPALNTGFEIVGSLLPALIPGEGEAQGANLAERAGQAALAADRTLPEAAVGLGTEQALGAAAGTAKAALAADAARGTARGSMLARTLRAVNPYEYAGKAGAGVETQLARVLGERAQGIVGPMARMATEGALLSAASTVDESELGDENLTGEALLSSMEYGALFGGGLGLTSVAGKKILTSAGRMAKRLADRAVESNLNGTAGQMRNALQAHGPGSIGNFMMENGWHPSMNAEQVYEWASSTKEKTGVDLSRILKDASPETDGISAHEAYKAVKQAMGQKLEHYRIAGGNGDHLEKLLDREVKIGLGMQLDPEAPEFLGTADAKKVYEKAWRDAGLTPRDQLGRRPRPPEEPSAVADKKLYAKLAADEGLAPKLEKPLKSLKPDEVGAYKKMVERALTDPATPMADKRALGVKLLTPGAIEREALEHVQGGINARNARRMELLSKAKSTNKAAYDQVFEEYQKKSTAWNHQVSEHSRLEKESMNNVIERNNELKRDFEHAQRITREHNENLRAGYTTVHNLRKRVDKVIPWSYAQNPDAVANAANEIRLAARHALEDQLESAFDKQAAKLKDDAVAGNYLHVKKRYAMIKDIERMAERGRAKHANMFGKPSRLAGLSHVAAGMGLALTGHPFAGALMGATNVGKHYAPKFAAYAAHKAAKIAELKALRQEVTIGLRRGVRSAAHQTPLTGKYAKVAIPNLSPHEMRVTAAEAMAKVVKLAGDTTELRSRLAAQAPDLPIFAPKSFAATEGAFRRSVMWLAAQVPPKIAKAISQGEKVNPKDIPDEVARSFMEHASVAVDPRSATDALARGDLTGNQAKAFKAIWPAIAEQGRATLKRIRAMDDGEMDFLPNHRIAQLHAAFGGGAHNDQDPSFTIDLQANATSLIAGQTDVNSAQPQKGQKKGGMEHASATSKGMAASVALSATASQAAEAGLPGRRKDAADLGM